MKILQFGFNSDMQNIYLPQNYPYNCVCYTGTHDNDTLMGWHDNTASDSDKAHAWSYCHISPEEGFNWGIIRTAYESKANYAIIQIQDILGLGSEARINTPSTLGGNWEWRIDSSALTAELAAKLKDLATRTGRMED